MRRKEPKFSPMQVINILLRKWFPLEPKIRLLELDFDDGDNDLEFFDSNSEMTSASLKVHAQGAPIDLDSMPYIQGEGTQQPPDVHSGSVLESNFPILKPNLFPTLRS